MSGDYGIEIRTSGGRSVKPEQLDFARHPGRAIDMIQQGTLTAFANEMKAHIRNHIQSGGVTPALSWVTTYTRNASGMGISPLYATGQLANSVNVKILGPSLIGVGIPWDKAHVGPTGTIPMGQLAKIHQEGATIIVTPEMKKYFIFMANEGRMPMTMAQVAVGQEIVIPPRPFMNQATKDAPKMAMKYAMASASVIRQYLFSGVNQLFTPIAQIMRGLFRF